MDPAGSPSVPDHVTVRGPCRRCGACFRTKATSAEVQCPNCGLRAQMGWDPTPITSYRSREDDQPQLWLAGPEGLPVASSVDPDRRRAHP